MPDRIGSKLGVNLDDQAAVARQFGRANEALTASLSLHLALCTGKLATYCDRPRSRNLAVLLGDPYPLDRGIEAHAHVRGGLGILGTLRLVAALLCRGRR